MPPEPTAKPVRLPHPVVYTIVGAPFGAVTGFVGVALAYLATKSGLTVQQGAGLVAVGAFPQAWKVLWAPAVDITLTRRWWYLISTALCGVGLFFSAYIALSPATFRLLEGITLLTSVASTFLGQALDGLVAHLTTAEDRGRVSGWYNAGNLGGSGIGGGLGLWLLTHVAHRWISGAILAGLCFACMVPISLLPNVPHESSGASVGRALSTVMKDFWQAIRSRAGLLSALICFMPVGTGAAGSVLAQAEVAAYWKVGPDVVSWVQGFTSGIVSMIGCLAGGYWCNRLRPRTGYILFGGLMGMVSLAMAWLPATPVMYVVGNLAYSGVSGMCWAAFTALVLAAIGAGNASTKYNAFASISNTPIWYMGLVLAAAETRFGPRGMLVIEAIFAAAGIAIYFIAAAIPARRRQPAAA